MGGKAEGDWRKGEWSSLVGAQRRGNWGWRRILGVSAVGLQLPGEALMPSLVGNGGPLKVLEQGSGTCLRLSMLRKVEYYVNDGSQ